MTLNLSAMLGPASCQPGVPAWAFYLLLRLTSEGLGATRPILYFGLLGRIADLIGI